MRALKRPDGINVIPLIDVMLVLLAIVLTISTFVATGAIKIDLPKADSAMSKDEPKSIEIAVDKEGIIYIDDTMVTPEEFGTKISTITNDDIVKVKADKDSLFNNFVFVMDGLKKQKIEKISIVTEGGGK